MIQMPRRSVTRFFIPLIDVLILLFCIFLLMPLVFVFVIARFPAGLVLYWVTTNLWTVGQGLITRRLVAKTPAPAAERRSSRTPPKDDGTSGNGASLEAPPPPVPSASAGARPRQVRRKKKRARR